MKYQELKEGIERRLNAAAEDFFTIGYYLRQISEGALSALCDRMAAFDEFIREGREEADDE